MDCNFCQKPMRATFAGRNKVPVWTCAVCNIQLDRKPVLKQMKLPGMDPGIQAVNVEEQNKARRRKAEHLMQCNLFDKIRRYETTFPVLEYIYAVPNGGFRPISVAKEMKREGTRPGVPDLVIPVARHGYNGDYIEMKTHDGVLSENQKRWHKFLKSEGSRVLVYRSMEEAWEEICWYLSLTVGTRKILRALPSEPVAAK